MDNALISAKTEQLYLSLDGVPLMSAAEVLRRLNQVVTDQIEEQGGVSNASFVRAALIVQLAKPIAETAPIDDQDFNWDVAAESLSLAHDWVGKAILKTSGAIGATAQ